MKIVYLIDQALDARNYDRFGIDTWIARGWQIEVWDITPLAHPRVWQGFVESGRALRKFDGYRLIESSADLSRVLSQKDRIDYYVDFGGESTPAVRAKLRLARRGASRIIVAVSSAPEAETVSSTPGLRNKLSRALHYGPVRSIKWVAHVVRNRIATRFAPPGVVVASGTDSLRRFARWADRPTVHAHNFDFDVFLRARATRADASPPFAVFLDQDLCFHPDYAYDDIPVYVTADEYFPAMRRGFKAISDALGLDVRVAAHPRSSYEQRAERVFGDAAIEHGRAPELIRDCRVAIGHYSGVIQMAVLFGKPVIFFTTHQLQRSALGTTVEKFAAELGKTAINLDEDLGRVDWRRELTINEDKYAAYRHRHIKMNGSPDIPHWEIVINYLEEHPRMSAA